MTSPHIKTHSMDTVADATSYCILWLTILNLNGKKKKKNYIEEEQLIL